MTPASKARQIDALRKHSAAKATAKRRATEKALRHLVKTGQPITIAAVAREAGVSRRYLNDHPEFGPRIRTLREQETQAATRPGGPPVTSGEASVIAALRIKVRDTEHKRAQETKDLRERIKQLEHDLATAHGEVLRLRSGLHSSDP